MRHQRAFRQFQFQPPGRQPGCLQRLGHLARQDAAGELRRGDVHRHPDARRAERFGVGDKVDARVTNIDTKTRRLGLSIKAREIAEEKEAIDQYGSSDSGASLGDILGAALNRNA